jgi:hypothetical protein
MSAITQKMYIAGLKDARNNAPTGVCHPSEWRHGPDPMPASRRRRSAANHRRSARYDGLRQYDTRVYMKGSRPCPCTIQLLTSLYPPLGRHVSRIRKAAVSAVQGRLVDEAHPGLDRAGYNSDRYVRQFRSMSCTSSSCYTMKEETPESDTKRLRCVSFTLSMTCPHLSIRPIGPPAKQCKSVYRCSERNQNSQSDSSPEGCDITRSSILTTRLGRPPLCQGSGCQVPSASPWCHLTRLSLTLCR